MHVSNQGLNGGRAVYRHAAQPRAQVIKNRICPVPSR